VTGKRVLITGSSQGIGFALAQGLAEHGAEIVLNGRDAGKLEAAAAKLAAAEAHAILKFCMPCITDHGSVGFPLCRPSCSIAA
jgi:gluconate 5-dehydrogenase